MIDEKWDNYILKTDKLVIKSNLHRSTNPITTQLAFNSLNDSLKQILRIVTNIIISSK